MAKKLTNIQAVTRLMNFSQHGALQQAFVVTAIEKYADQCIQAGAERFDSAWLNGAAWVGCAREAKAAMEAHVGK